MRTRQGAATMSPQRPRRPNSYSQLPQERPVKRQQPMPDLLARSGLLGASAGAMGHLLVPSGPAAQRELAFNSYDYFPQARLLDV